MPIQLTRSLLRAALNGDLDNAEMRQDKYFKLMVPLSINGDSSYLNPIDTWSNKDDFDIQAKKLVEMFVENFKRFQNEWWTMTSSMQVLQINKLCTIPTT